MSKKKLGRGVTPPWIDLIGWFPALPLKVMNNSDWSHITAEQPRRTYTRVVNMFDPFVISTQQLTTH